MDGGNLAGPDRTITTGEASGFSVLTRVFDYVQAAAGMHEGCLSKNWDFLRFAFV